MSLEEKSNFIHSFITLPFYRAVITGFFLFFLLRDNLNKVAILAVFIVYFVATFYILLMLFIKNLKEMQCYLSLIKSLLKKEAEIKLLLEQVTEIKKVVLQGRFLSHADLHQEIYGNKNYLAQLKAFYEE